MKKLNLNKLFKNKPDLIDDLHSYYDEPKKFYFYTEGNGLVNNLSYQAYMQGYFTSDTFFGLIQRLFRSNIKLNTNDFLHYVYENLVFNERELKDFRSTWYLFNHRQDYNKEKWAKLLTIDLYNKDIISPFIYKKFDVNGVSFGLENFYFRGYNLSSLMDSFYYHIKRISNYMPGYNMAVKRKSKKDSLNHFYRICIDYFGMGFDPDNFDKTKFLSNENLFIENASQQQALKNSRYYKRRVLIA